MNTTEIQERVNAIRVKMTERGLARPSVQFTIKSDEQVSVGVYWADNTQKYIWDHSHYFKSDSDDKALRNAMEWACDLPSPDEAKMAQFREALATAIELGNQHGIDVQFVNPLIEAMKRLSENAIEDHSA